MAALWESGPNQVVDFLSNFPMSWLACGVCVASLAGFGGGAAWGWGYAERENRSHM